MASNLITAGHEVALWSHSVGKAHQFTARGGVACATPAEVAQRSDYVFLCVGADPATEWLRACPVALDDKHFVKTGACVWWMNKKRIANQSSSAAWAWHECAPRTNVRPTDDH